MAREFVIPLSTVLPFEAAAQFVAAMTYPNDAGARDRYTFGLCRWAIMRRARLDKEWRRSEVPLRPDYVFWNNKKKLLFKKDHKYFTKLLTLGAHQILPYVPTFFGGKAKRVGDVIADPQSCIGAALDAMGYGQGSINTVKTRYWQYARPVCHALAALVQTGSLLEDTDECCAGDAMLEIFFNPEALTAVLNFAEKFRGHVASIEGINVDHDQLVIFTKG